MAGSITVATSDLGGGYSKYSIAWLSDAAGAASGTAFAVKRGHLHQVTFVPDAGGTQPSDLHDITLLDASGFDVLAGVGANLSNAAAARFVPLVGDGTTKAVRAFLEAGNLTPTVAAAGNAKGGTINLIVGP